MKGFIKELIKGLGKCYLSGTVIMALLIKCGLNDADKEERNKKYISACKEHPMVVILAHLAWPATIFNNLMNHSRRKHTS